MTTLMRTNDMNEVKKNMEKNYLAVITDQDTVDSEDLISNISGVVEPQNKILYQFEMNPVKRCLEMLEETGEKEEDHKTFFTVDSEDLTPNTSEVVEQQNKISYQIEMNPVKKCLKILEESGGKKEDHKMFYEQIDEYMKFGIHENSVFNETTSNTNMCQERNDKRPMKLVYDSTELEGTVHTPRITGTRKKRKLEQVT